MTRSAHECNPSSVKQGTKCWGKHVRHKVLSFADVAVAGHSPPAAPPERETQCARHDNLIVQATDAGTRWTQPARSVRPLHRLSKRIAADGRASRAAALLPSLLACLSRS